MTATTVHAEPRIVHALPGRVRLRVPAIATRGEEAVERRFRQVPGVIGAHADRRTENVLVQFRPGSVRMSQLMAVARALDEPGSPGSPEAIAAKEKGSWPSALTSERDHHRRARITVRGLDRSPDLARRVEDALQRFPGVHAKANPLTGRVLVEITNHEIELEDLLGTVAQLEFPEIPGEGRPSHPLDPGPLRQSALRVGTSVAGLAVVAVRQLGGVSVRAPVVMRVAYITSIFNSIPFLRQLLGAVLGRDVSEAAVTLPNIAANTLSGNPVSLTLSGAEALATLTETRSREKAWRAYERQLEGAPSATPGSIVRLESGDRLPMPGRVVEGSGSAIASDGMPHAVSPGMELGSGARLFGGPFVVELGAAATFAPKPREGRVGPSTYDHYLQAAGSLSLLYTAGMALGTRSLDRTFASLLLVNPRVAMVGEHAATTMAEGRVLRAGVTVVGTRPHRHVRKPDTVVIDGARLLTDGLEVVGAIPLRGGWAPEDVRRYAAGIAAACGSPYGGALRTRERVHATAGRASHGEMRATVDGVRYVMRPARHGEPLPDDVAPRQAGTHRVLLLVEHSDAAGADDATARDDGRDLVGVLLVRPRLAAGVRALVASCRQHGIALCLLDRAGSSHARQLAERAGIEVADERDACEVIGRRQRGGRIVFFVSDGIHAGPGFSKCDLAIGVTDRRHHFSARADLLAVDLVGVAAIVEAGVLRDEAATDAVVLSTVANVVGAVLGIRGLAVESAGRLVEAVALGALAASYFRLRGGERTATSTTLLRDPHPERWGRQSPADVLREVDSTEQGLAGAVAERRQRQPSVPHESFALAEAVLAQLRSPITVIMGAGALLSLFLGGGADVIIIAGTLGINVLLGAWQERKAERIAEELDRLQATTVRVLRDGAPAAIPSTSVVRGDVLLLAPGDRVGADARLLAAEGLEVDEAPLTGESLPVQKVADGGTDAQHVVLDGSDVVAGTGRAVAFAVGRQSRLGTTAAAVSTAAQPASPLADRLSQILHGALPIALAGGFGATAIGLLRGQPLLGQLALGIGVALAAVPEGLPLLAGVGEATVAKRLAARHAVVRRPASVEALGRADVACVDKTGTLTEGRLAVQLVATLGREAPPDALAPALRDVLRAAALASPHPDAWAAARDGTDAAVLRAADEAGLAADVRAPREREVPFQALRPFHAACAGGRLYVKGAPEVLLARCARLRVHGSEVPLEGRARQALDERAASLAELGLRVLLVAEAGDAGDVQDPRGLTALGFVALSDRLRAGVAEAVRRCREAGVRVVMLTGDHPETARAIARAATLLDGGGVLTGTEMADLDDGALAERLEQVTVVARATPLDKLRIVEALRARGHTVAMTGDGVNDAPALRLADVGVAMGRGGTEVARQAADVVLADDDFSTLVEALVEGRGFWRNLRRSVALLLGGNLGELGLIVGASAFGMGRGLTVRQVLVVNLVTDLLPGLSLVMQPPEHRRLAALAREGMTAFEGPLRDDVLRRAVATAVPSLGALLLAGATGSDARSLGFAALVSTQLAQTLDAGRADGNLTRPAVGAVGLSAVSLVAAFAIPASRSALQLVVPTPAGLALVAGASLLAPVLDHALARAWAPGTARAADGADGYTASPPGSPPRPSLEIRMRMPIASQLASMNEPP